MKTHWKLLFGSGILAVAAVAAGPWVALASDPCSCERTICSPDGFKKTLVDFSVDAVAGTSSWTYEVCSPGTGTCVGGAHAGESCVGHEFCRRAQGPTAGDPSAACSRECATDDFKDLSHVDVVLPGIGECVSETQQVTISQVCSPTCDPTLACSVSDRDPSCEGVEADKVLKCDVAPGENLDPGECVRIQVTIAGESPTLGPGAIDEVTKAGPTCTTDSICGPSCGCATTQEQCLTRTAGFWGTHPAITAQFLPITVCGKTLETVDAGACNSVSEALCISPGVEAQKCDKNPAYQQLVRQLAAAKLNLAATAANGGSCGSDITTLIAGCELLCNRTQNVISNSGCIQGLDAFNNSQDTFQVTPSPFDSPGPADPSSCQGSSGNGLVIGKKCGTFNCKY